MYIKYDSLSRFEPLVITLCNPGSRYINNVPTNIVGILTNTSDEEIVANFNSISEFNFVIHDIQYEDEDERAHTYFLYKAVQPRRLVFVKGIGYFVIKNVVENFDESGQRFKDVSAESIEQEIQNKKVPYIEDGTYEFFTETQIAGGKEGILNILVKNLSLWKVGHIDDAVKVKYRTFEDVSPDLNILGFMYEDVQDAYECIFIFDTVNRLINVYDQNNYVKKTDIFLTRDDVIQDIDIEENADDLYTAMTVLGDENVMISAINPLGVNSIYNFTYYVSWMTPELGIKVQEWQKQISENETPYYNYNLEYYNKMEDLAIHTHELEALSTQNVIYRKCRENIVAESNTDSVKDYNKIIAENGGTEISATEEISEAIAQIDNLIAICDSKRANEQDIIHKINTEINDLKKNINQIHQVLSINNYFTVEEQEELQNYIFEGSYTDDYVTFTDIMTYSDKFKQMKVLYDRAKVTLDKASKPTQQFNISAENFVFIKEFEHFTTQLETGCLINIELESKDIASLFLTNITINYDDHILNMTFGNRFNKFDPKSLFESVLGKISKSSNTLTFIKDTIFPIKNGELNKMREAIETSRDLTLDSAIASDGEDVLIDGTGYTGRKKISSGAYDPRQIKINGRNIVFTDDAWETCKTAIGEIILGEGESTYGINAKTLIGEMIIGNNLRIIDNDGKDLFTVMDDKIVGSLEDVNGRMTDIEAKAGNIEIEISELAANSGKATTVKTTSGYIFDKDGLTIHKSGDEMTNLLDNTGMYVKRSGTTILEANNEGVIAINLTAQQYLHVGSYSRFEDYSTDLSPNRTACFYISETGGE